MPSLAAPLFGPADASPPGSSAHTLSAATHTEVGIHSTPPQYVSPMTTSGANGIRALNHPAPVSAAPAVGIAAATDHSATTVQNMARGQRSRSLSTSFSRPSKKASSPWNPSPRSPSYRSPARSSINCVAASSSAIRISASIESSASGRKRSRPLRMSGH